MKPDTLAGRLGRTIVVASLAISLVAVLVGLVVGAAIVVGEEDATSLAMARVFEAEALQHRDDPVAFANEMRSEIAEQAGFDRAIEIWRDGALIASGPTPRPFSAIARPDGCHFADAGEHRWRACALRTDGDRIEIVVASRVEGISRALARFAFAVLLAVLVGMTLFALFARRVVRSMVRPVDELRAAVGRIEGARLDTRIGAQWGLAEVDSLAVAFDALLERMQTATARERQFLFDASHELRTPLTRLCTQIEIAREQAEPGGDIAARLASADASARALVAITESILALARGELPRGETVNVADIAREHVLDLPAEQRRRVEVEAVDEALVRGDTALITLAVRNLVENALKFSDSNVRIAVTVESERVVVVVEDHGPGIAESERTAVLEPFYRGAHARSATRGAGLGLALVAHVAKVYGGAIALAEAQPNGLRVTFSLPVWTPLSARPAASTDA